MNIVIKTIYVVAAVCWLSLHALAAGQESSHFYEIRMQERAVGYIERQPLTLAESQGRQTTERTTVTFVKAQNESQPAPQNIVEKHVYQGDNNALQFYSLEYHEGATWAQQSYLFSGNSVAMTILHNNNKVKEVSVAIPANAYIVTDYFSLLPLLATVKAHPVNAQVMDVKRITPQHSQAPAQQIVIQPGGDRLYSAQGQPTLCRTFVVKWADGTTLHFWLSAADSTLLRIEDTKSKTVVAFSSSEVKARLAESKARLPRSERPLPFVLGRTYVYTFRFQDKPWGSLQFTIERKDQPHPHYLVTAQGDMQALRDKLTFTSRTAYGLDLKILAYYISEGEHTEIQCEFNEQGVKEKYRRQQSILERFLPLDGDFVFLDNNGIHHFAIFMTQFPAHLKTPMFLPIFHPRRMMSSESMFKVRENQGSYFVVDVETPYYNMQMTVTQTGQLVRYVQGKLEVVLSEKKD